MPKNRVNGQPPTQHGGEPLLVENLRLDPENPRLASVPGQITQKEILRTLWTEMAVDEVALSIAANGFWEEEPVFVIPGTGSMAGKYVVVEGNRRLAAVQLLRSEALREEIGATDLPKISERRRKGLDALPASVYATRRELWQFFGFRHINGPKPWDAYSKANYVAKVHEEYHIPLPKIADTIGDRYSTVERLYRGYKLLDQAEKMTSFRKEDRIRNRFYFSHLYTAADQPEFQKFLGITPERSLKPNPVPKSKVPELGWLMLWLYGSKSKQKEPEVRTQNPDLNLLREVISKRESRDALKAGYSLQRAHEISLGDPRRFRDALTRSKEDLIEANGAVTTGYKGEEDLWATMKEIHEITPRIAQEMLRKRNK